MITLKQKLVIVSIVTLIFISMFFSSFCILNENFSILKHNVQFTKIDIDMSKNTVNSYCIRDDFNLDLIINGIDDINTLIFKGKIVNIEEYKLSWMDKNGGKWGPYSRTILTVETSKIYHGKIPTKSKNIKILYANSMSHVFDNSVKIELNKEYVFANCWIIDECYIDYIKSNNPISYENDVSLQYADVIIGGAWNSMMPVENDSITVYHKYFKDIKDINEKKLSYNSENAERLTNNEALKTGEFISLKLSDFENNLWEIIEKTEK